MEFILIAFLTATGKLIILSKMMGLVRMVKYQVLLDIAFTFLVPILFIGTFSGAIVAVLSGIWFSALLWFLSLFVTVPVKTKRTRHV
jgi:hypothetical protein